MVLNEICEQFENFSKNGVYLDNTATSYVHSVPRKFSYRIEEKDEFRIVGIKERYEVKIDENFTKIPLQWFKATVREK